MPPSSLLVAVDMESLAALRIEPHLRTAAVYLDLYLFGGHIHVDFEHFPRCYQLKSLLEKFRILHVAAFLPELCKKSHAFILRLAAGPRGTSAQGTHEVGRRPFMPDSTLSRPSAALLRLDAATAAS